MKKFVSVFKNYPLGIILSLAIALLSTWISSYIPKNLVSASVVALLIGIIINPVIARVNILKEGINFVSKRLLKLAIMLMGISLSFTQILRVGGFSLIVMSFTLIAAFGFGWLFGKMFRMDWKLSSLISAGTGICGGSAIAAISPVIKAKDSDIAYAIAATFLFDVVMVIIFPLIGKAIGMSDLGYGLWVGTAVNDTSSVVAAGFTFSDIAGNFSIIVKLTRTLSIIPIVLIFSLINVRVEKKQSLQHNTKSSRIERVKPNMLRIFPWFILGFLSTVAINSTGLIPILWSNTISAVSKFIMVMALGAIGMKTNFKEMRSSGFKPMLHGFIISLLVVAVSFGVQYMLGQI